MAFIHAHAYVHIYSIKKSCMLSSKCMTEYMSEYQLVIRTKKKIKAEMIQNSRSEGKNEV